MQRCDTPLLLATRCAIVLAGARGWSAATITGVFYGLKAVLDGHTCGDPVPLSQVRERVRPRSHSSAVRIADVLAEMELLHDDTTAAIRIWIDRRTGELPAGFGRDVRAWLVVLLDGDARTRPRSPATLRVHLGIVQPFIECWAAERGQLREITSGDVDTVLEPLRGHRRYNAIMALRSLFRFAKRRGLRFAGHRQPLGELTRDALLAWLGYRRATWPDTANRHVLLSRISALGTGPVSPDYLDKHQLRGISLEQIRRDRILREALATGGDPLHLALVFNIDHTNAMAYANAARNLLSSRAEQALSCRPE